MGTNELLADYFEDRARWSAGSEIKLTDDAHHEHRLRGLTELAAYIRSLPVDDERLCDLAQLCTIDWNGPASAAFFPGPNAPALIARFRQDDPAESCDAFLDRLVKPAAQDWLAFAVKQGWLPDVLD